MSSKMQKKLLDPHTHGLQNNLVSQLFISLKARCAEEQIWWESFSSSDVENSAEFQALMADSHATKKQFMLDAIDYYAISCAEADHYWGYESIRAVIRELTSIVMRKNLAYTDDDIFTLFHQLNEAEQALPFTEDVTYTVQRLPLLSAIKQIANNLKVKAKKDEPADAMHEFIRQMLTWHLFKEPRSRWVDMDKLHMRLKSLLPAVQTTDVAPLFEPVDAGNALNAYLASLSPKADMHALFLLFLNSRASKPSKKWLTSLYALQDTLGKDTCAKVAYHICDIVLTHNYKRIEQNLVTEWICDTHVDLLKGVVWSLDNQPHKQSDDYLLRLLTAAFGKQKDAGLFSAKLGNACLTVLDKRITTDIAHHLVTLSNEKHLDKKCKTRLQESIALCCEQLGKTVDELGEMAVSDFGFE